MVTLIGKQVTLDSKLRILSWCCTLLDDPLVSSLLMLVFNLGWFGCVDGCCRVCFLLFGFSYVRSVSKTVITTSGKLKNNSNSNNNNSNTNKTTITPNIHDQKHDRLAISRRCRKLLQLFPTGHKWCFQPGILRTRPQSNLAQTKIKSNFRAQPKCWLQMLRLMQGPCTPHQGLG